MILSACKSHHISKNRPIFVRLQPHHIVPNSTADFARTLVCSKNGVFKEAGSAWIWFFIGICPCFKRDAFRDLKLWDWKFDALLVPPKKKVPCFQGFFSGGAARMRAEIAMSTVLCEFFEHFQVVLLRKSDKQKLSKATVASSQFFRNKHHLMPRLELISGSKWSLHQSWGGAGRCQGECGHYFGGAFLLGTWRCETFLSPSTPMTQQLPCRPKLHCMVLTFVPMVRTSKLSYFDELKRMLGFFVVIFMLQNLTFLCFRQMTSIQSPIHRIGQCFSVG